VFGECSPSFGVMIEGVLDVGLLILAEGYRAWLVPEGGRACDGIGERSWRPGSERVNFGISVGICGRVR
jgi:hypothetical protein